MSSPGPQRTSFRRRFKDGLKKVFHSNPSSRSSSPHPRPSAPYNVLDPAPNKEGSSLQSPTPTLQVLHARVPLTKTQSIPPGFHAHAGGPTVVHTATELALSSLNVLAAPFTHEPGIPAVLLPSSVSSLPRPSAAIASVPDNANSTSESGNITLPVNVRPTLPQDMPSSDCHSHSGSVDHALEVHVVASTSQTTEAQGIIPAPVNPLEETASAALNDSRQSATSGSSSEGDRTLSSEVGSEHAESSDATLEEREAVRLSSIAWSYYNTFKSRGDIADIGEAISAQQTAVQLTAEDDPLLPDQLDGLGIFYRERFDIVGNLADITEAISVQQMAVELTPEGHAGLPGHLNNLGNSYSSRFDHMGNLADIAEAISAQQRAVQLTPEGHPDLPGRLNNLGVSYSSRFDHMGNLVDITEAISAQQRAVQLTPEGHPDLPSWLNNLGISYQSRFDRMGNLADIAEAISAKQRAVQLTPEGHPDLPGRLNNLGISYSSRFDHMGNLADITEAISAQQRAVQLTPEGHADLPSRLNNLGNSYQSRFDHMGNLADITEAISAQQRAVQLTPEGHADLPSRLNNLGVSYWFRFNHMGNLADITEAISAQQRAVQLMPEGHVDLPGQLNNLGNSYQSRFNRMGNLADIAEAISAKQRAVQLAPEGHANLPGWLNNLGISYQSRFNRMGNLADITEAISAKQRAVQLTPEGHADLPSRLNNLGNSYQSRFDRMGNLADIAEAISAQQRAVQLAPEGHANLPGWLNNLGNSYKSHFNRMGNLADIAEAISAQQRAVQLAPEGHANLPGWLNNLGISYQSRFNRMGNLADITEAISAKQRAVQLTPEGHANLPSRLNNLGNSYQSRFDQAGNTEDLNASIFHIQSAATSSFGAPQNRLKASRRWAQILNLHTPLSPDVLTAFETAMNLLTLVAGLEQTVKGRYAQLQDAAGIALNGAAAACRLERPDKAVEWLEHGRCLVWKQLNDLRTPLDDLQAQDCQLAQHLTDVSKQLQKAASTRNTLDPSMDIAAKILVQDEASSHLALAQDWDNLLVTVRNIPGFESFLLPSPCSTLLQHLPALGPIIIINVNKDRCDAIALWSKQLKQNEPLHIPLPHFSLEKANEYRHALSAQLDSKSIRMREADVGSDGELSGRGFERRPMGEKRREAPDMVIHNVLKCLWLEVAKPILEMLGYTKYDPSSDAPVPRIWWCPTGVMSFLPIHAAGIYNDTGAAESVLNYTVSSYTPTVTTLTDRVKNNRPIKPAVSGLFMTSQPSVQGACWIPGTTKEVEDVYAKATANGLRVLRSSGSELIVPDLLEHVKDYSSIHLACHASQNAADPLQSRFRLHEGELTLGTIIQMDLKDADLAFLSACQTSTGEEKLADEAVHLAAGMLAAGYRRVVATMWSIKDEHAPDVANDFYGYLWSRREEGSGDGFDGSLSAHALHHAVQRLRERIGDSEDSLLTWVPYVHFGY